LGLNYAANEPENYRAGIQAIPHGQTESRARLGMSRGRPCGTSCCRKRAPVIPPVTNDFISMFKDSSIVPSSRWGADQGVWNAGHVPLRLHRAGADDGGIYFASAIRRHISRGDWRKD